MYPPLCVRAGGESECALDSVCESGRLVREWVCPPLCVYELEVSESVSLPSTACWCVCE